jgi:hypothetical protein
MISCWFELSLCVEIGAELRHVWLFSVYNLKIPVMDAGRRICRIMRAFSVRYLGSERAIAAT